MVSYRGDIAVKTPRSTVLFGLILLAAFAGCSRESADPVGPDDTLNIDANVVHRTVDALDLADDQNIRTFDLTLQPGDDPLPAMAKDGHVNNTVAIRGLATLAPPVVADLLVQVTDMQVQEQGRNLVGVAVANYAGEQTRGALQVFDLSDPLAPTLASEVQLPDTEYNGVAVDSDVAYAVGNDSEMGVVDTYDISDPAEPKLVGRLEMTADTALDAVLDRGTLYVVTGIDGGLHWLDVSDPLNPTQTMTLTIPDARSVEMYKNHKPTVLHGGGVYVFNNNGSLWRSFAVSDLGSQAPTRGVMYDQRFYVNTESGITLVDIKHDDVYEVLDSEFGTPNGMATDNGVLWYRANGEAGLQVLQRVSSRGLWSFRILGVLDIANAGSSNSVEARSGYLFSGDGRGGVLISGVSERFDGDDDDD